MLGWAVWAVLRDQGQPGSARLPNPNWFGAAANHRPSKAATVYRELSMGLDDCFQILKRLSFGKGIDLFGVEPADKIKTKGRICKKTDLSS